MTEQLSSIRFPSVLSLVRHHEAKGYKIYGMSGEKFAVYCVLDQFFYIWDPQRGNFLEVFPNLKDLTLEMVVEDIIQEITECGVEPEFDD